MEELAPASCWLCGAAAPGGVACAVHDVPEDLVPRCGRCAAELGGGLPPGTRCHRCRRRAPAFASLTVAGAYREPLRAWVLAWKHGPRPALTEPLAGLLLEAGAELLGETGSVLVPVPSHPLRRLERGGDGVLGLARVLARRTGRAQRSPLVRRRATPPQGEPGATSRAANVRDAFRVRPATWLHGARVVLLDDVVTTGATVEEAARALCRAGVERVDVLALARAPAW